MSMKEAQQRMRQTYLDCLSNFADDDFRAITWGDRYGKSAKRRYEQMDETIPFKQASVLEIGCGFGSFFKLGFQAREYHGIDVMPEMIDRAKQFQSDSVTFSVCDVSSLNLEKKDYDVAIASGVAGNRRGPASRPPDLCRMLFSMASHAKYTLVNFPSTWATVRSPGIEYFDPASLLNVALIVSPIVTIHTCTGMDTLVCIEKQV